MTGTTLFNNIKLMILDLLMMGLAGAPLGFTIYRRFMNPSKTPRSLFESTTEDQGLPGQSWPRQSLNPACAVDAWPSCGIRGRFQRPDADMGREGQSPACACAA